jgi:hypothetical protein
VAHAPPGGVGLPVLLNKLGVEPLDPLTIRGVSLRSGVGLGGGLHCGVSEDRLPDCSGDGAAFLHRVRIRVILFLRAEKQRSASGLEARSQTFAWKR